jgi:hypothetical protein
MVIVGQDLGQEVDLKDLGRRLISRLPTSGKNIHFRKKVGTFC